MSTLPPVPSSIASLLLGGLDLFDDELGRTTDADLPRQTPCDDWDVEALVRHTADTADRATAFLREQTWEASTSSAPATARWVEARDDLRAALAEVTTDDRWPLPDDAPVAKLRFHGCDLVIHRWDLAVARGDEHELPAGWVDYMDGFFRSLPAEVLRRPGAFEDPLEAFAGDGPTRRLMAFLGRRPFAATQA